MHAHFIEQIASRLREPLQIGGQSACEIDLHVDDIIEFLHELPYSFYNCFANMVQGADGRWRIRGMEDILPVVYSIKAIKSQ